MLFFAFDLWKWFGTLHTAIPGGVFCMYTRLLYISFDDAELNGSPVTFISYRGHCVIANVHNWCVDVFW